MPDTALLERIAAGESLRSLGRELGVAHTTLARSLRRPEVASELRAANRRLRAQHAEERRAEKELRRRARRQAAYNRGLDRRRRSHRPSDLEGLSGTDRVSTNDELAAEVVRAGGGVQALIERTGLRTRLGVYESIDPQVVSQALANDDRRPLAAGTFRRFAPDAALVARRAAGESLSRLAEDYEVSRWTVSRYLARPEVAEELRSQQRQLKEQEANEAEPDDQSYPAMLGADYAARISHIWCPVHNRRTYVTSVDNSGGETRLEVAGCCEEAGQELVRWLKIYRAVLPNGVVFTPSPNAPASAPDLPS